jgi:hypothetical protein
MLHPLRCNASRRQHEEKPIAARESRSDLVVPLLRASNALFAVEDRNTVPDEDADQSIHETAVSGRM